MPSARPWNLCVLLLVLFGWGFCGMASSVRAADPDGAAPDPAKTSTPEKTNQTKPADKAKAPKPGPKAKKPAIETSTVAVGDPAARRYRFDADIQLADVGPAVVIRVLTPDPQNPGAPAAGEVVLKGEGDGESLEATLRSAEVGKQSKPPSAHYRYERRHPAKVAMPTKPPKGMSEEEFQAKQAKKIEQATEKAKRYEAGAERLEKELEAAGREPRSADGHWIPVAIDIDRGRAAVWVEGGFVGHIELPADAQGAIGIVLPKGSQARNARVSPPRDSLLEPLDLTAYANDHFSAPLGDSPIRVDGIEFQPMPGAQNQVNLSPAHWLEWKNDGVPWATEGYDVGANNLSFDPRWPILRVPCVDYIAAHVLAVADDDPERTATLKLRPRSHHARLALQWDFDARVPRAGELAAMKGGPVVDTPAGRLAHVVVPMEALAQDLSIPQEYSSRRTEMMQIELTKEVHVTVNSPWACRFRYRPLGLSSGVRIAAMTLERAPLQMRVTSSETGHAFVQPANPVFQVRLENITAQAQPFTLVARARHKDGTPAEARTSGSVEAGKTAEVSLELPVPKRGYYTLEMAVIDGAKRELVRRTSFAVLSPDTRKHRDESPFGTYDYGGTSYGVPNANELLPSVYVKLGMRYAMTFSKENRQKYGLLNGGETNITYAKPGEAPAVWRKASERDPDKPPYAITYHEAGVSADHMSRVPNIFVEKPYVPGEKEEERMKNMRENSIANFRAMRKEFPNVKIALVNGPIPTLEAFLAYDFPTDLFDSAGNEAGAYNRPPEAQPPDWIANNASLWMERQMLDAYGYKDKPITQCHEICYPCTSPGNLDLATQADYFVRHAVHSLTWGIPQIRMGIICDVGASYYYSNWGASGFCNCYPEMNVKPSFVAWATMTSVLDGAKYRRVIDLGSPSLYAVAFDRADGQHVLALWTIRGRRPVSLKFKPAAGAEFRLVDDQANETGLHLKDGAVEVTLSPSPVYLITPAEFDGAQADAPQYDDKPAATAAVISDLASLDDWTIEKGHNALLEYYNFLEPRRLGEFDFKPVAEFEGRNGVLQVTPSPVKDIRQSIAMPRYAVLSHKKGIPIPGEPTEIGVWVNGNSSWGRLIYELSDASGQQWVSIGNPMPKWQTPFDNSVVPDTHLSKRTTPVDDWCDNDSFGWSRIDFDGWRYLAFPAPGQYPGEGYHWPGNVEWFHDKDGLVHYPLTLKKIIVQLPARTLHMHDFAPAPRPEIYLKDLTAAQGDMATYMLKTSSDARPLAP